MLIKSLFDRDIFRSINGVVKAHQLDESSVWQELDEFVVTRELDQHFRRFFSTYSDAIRNPGDPEIAGNIGVWISGFFGSGKSHFIKVLSYLLKNGEHTHAGQSRRAVEFFESKIKDAMLFGDVKYAVASNTDVILFNIESKADSRGGRDAILYVFLKVLNEMQGYSGDHPHIAHMERYLAGKGKLDQFKAVYRKATGTEWVAERDAYQFNRDEVAKALAETLPMSKESAEKWVDGAESSFALTVENFCRWVKEYLDSKGPQHRLIFLVDEVGQFIGTDSHLMLSLQTITENLGTACGGRAWVVVTSQEDIDAVLGEFKQSKANDFSKIQGRFRTRLSLSSANVDEVIQSRLIGKVPDVVEDLKAVFAAKGDILRHQLTFSKCGMTLQPYRNEEDFVRNYPFIPYQFQLVQKIFEAVRKAGATGLHLSRGERSILDAFQSAARQVALQDVGVLVPLYQFYPSIESFLDTAVKRTIDQAGDNASLEQFDVRLLQVLFLIRYVEEMKANVDNLVTLCMEQIDEDRLVLRRKVEESLQRLEKETLVNRSGDLYFFLTNEEQDINREIKAVELGSSEDTRLLGELIFGDVLRDNRKYLHPVTKLPLPFNRVCDLIPFGNRLDGALLVSAVTPLNDDYALCSKAKCIMDSTADNGSVLIRLGNDETLGRELRVYLQTDRYIKHKNDGTLPGSTKKILNDYASENQERRARLVGLLSSMLAQADYYVAGQELKIKAATPLSALDEAVGYLVENTFSRMGYIRSACPDPLREIQAILRGNDITQQTLKLETEEGNKQAIEDLRSHIDLCASANRQIVLYELINTRYARRPYGWAENEVLILVARLLVLGEISLMMDGALLPIDRAYEAITNSGKQRKITISKRRTSDPKAIQKARGLGKDIFQEMGPDGEDALFAFLQHKLQVWQTALSAYRPLADTGDYPGKDQIADGLSLIKKLLADTDSFKFVERFNDLRKELLDFADEFRDLEHFYEHQRPIWEKLRKASERFQLNRVELERDPQAGPALNRMREILTAPAPYALVREAEELIAAVQGVNSVLVSDRRKQAAGRIDDLEAALVQDLAKAQAPDDLCAACLKPLDTLRSRAAAEESLAHIAQAETEAVKVFDAAVLRVEDFLSRPKPDAQPGSGPTPPPPPVKRHRVVLPAAMVKTQYLETMDQVNGFLDALRTELQRAIENNERVQIR